MAGQSFVRINFDGTDAPPDGRRKLRFRHKDLRDVVTDTKKTVGELITDPFGGWPYLLLYGLRWQDLKITLDKCSELIDKWADRHIEEDAPLSGLSDLLIEALNASGFVKIKAEGADTPAAPPSEPEGNELPRAVIP